MGQCLGYEPFNLPLAHPICLVTAYSESLRVFTLLLTLQQRQITQTATSLFWWNDQERQKYIDNLFVHDDWLRCRCSRHWTSLIADGQRFYDYDDPSGLCGSVMLIVSIRVSHKSLAQLKLGVTSGYDAPLPCRGCHNKSVYPHSLWWKHNYLQRVWCTRVLDRSTTA